MRILIAQALQERVRRKELYILLVLAVLLLLFLSSGNASISVNGESITGFDRMFSLAMMLINGTLCLLALVLTVPAIPEEYRRKTSHLVWVRNISQPRYHLALAMAGFLTAMLAALLLYGILARYLIVNDRAAWLPGLVPSYLLLGLNMAVVSAMAGSLSVVMPALSAGVTVLLITAAGLASPVLRLLSYMTDGIAARLFRILAGRLPNLDAVRVQATEIVKGGPLDLHTLFVGLAWLYAISLLFLVLRKKEA